MVFSSLIFLFFFLPATLFCYYIVPQKFIRVRNAVLLLFSLFFYFYGEPRLIGMLIFSILMNYLFGLSMRSTYRKPLLILCVIANLSLLGVFKYLNFFISTADSLLGLSIPVTGIVMPIGISFYTFQALSYVIDVYRREVPPQHDPFSLALYVSMFPQLIAGPIVRYHDINVQLAVRKHSFAQFSEGISRFLFGLSKKVLLSNVFAQIADGVFKYAPSELSAAGAWMGAIGYTLQIYFDFSGYSDMAIGLGKMFGFEFLENFNYPYISKSVTEFWRRWHISLSTWFRDYVYIPLGGNRCSPARHIFNLLAVWTLTGFWHGANWTFMAWGLYFGVLLILEKKFLAGWITRLPSVLQHVYALFFHRHRLGVLPQRFDGTGGAVPRQHVHLDGAAQSVRNRISAAVLAIPAVRCCTVCAGVPASQGLPCMARAGVSGAGCPVHTVHDAPARQQLQPIYLLPLLRRAET